MNDPVQILQTGRQLLDPLLESHGFKWVVGESGPSSGGHFASGEYVRDNRRLEMHFRHSLGLVTYHVGEQSVEHAAYMRAVLGAAGGNQYPGFSNDPLDAFRHLAHDLSSFCGVFLSGAEREFEDITKKVDADSRIIGIRRVP